MCFATTTVNRAVLICTNHVQRPMFLLIQYKIINLCFRTETIYEIYTFQALRETNKVKNGAYCIRMIFTQFNHSVKKNLSSGSTNVVLLLLDIKLHNLHQKKFLFQYYFSNLTTVVNT